MCKHVSTVCAVRACAVSPVLIRSLFQGHAVLHPNWPALEKLLRWHAQQHALAWNDTDFTVLGIAASRPQWAPRMWRLFKELYPPGHPELRKMVFASSINSATVRIARWLIRTDRTGLRATKGERVEV